MLDKWYQRLKIAIVEWLKKPWNLGKLDDLEYYPK